MCRLIILNWWKEKSSAYSSCGACEILSLNLTLHSMISWLIEGSISLYPFTPYGYPTKIHAILYVSSDFLFLNGIQAHTREMKTWKWVTFGLFPVQALKGVQSLKNLWGDLFCM
jgi:hypothetical protein